MVNPYGNTLDFFLVYFNKICEAFISIIINIYFAHTIVNNIDKSNQDINKIILVLI